MQLSIGSKLLQDSIYLRMFLMDTNDEEEPFMYFH
jgi:hypothetical protein